MRNQTSHLRTAASPNNQLGKLLVDVDMERKARGRLLITHPDQPRVSRCINDNYCVKMSVSECRDIRTLSDFKCKLSCCRSCTFCCQATTKERTKSCFKFNKMCKRCFLCRSVEFCPEYQECPNYCRIYL